MFTDEVAQDQPIEPAQTGLSQWVAVLLACFLAGLIVIVGVIGILRSIKRQSPAINSIEEHAQGAPAGQGGLPAGLRRRNVGVRNHEAGPRGDAGGLLGAVQQLDGRRANMARLRYEQKLQLREEERLMREEQEKQEEKEQQEREEELYAEWRGNISVETSGNEALDPEQLQRALEELADYIVKSGSVELGQLPSRFPWLPSRDIQLRIRQLEASGKLCGIMDNARGKYVYISRKELDGVAAFIRSKGRVSFPWRSIRELSRECMAILGARGASAMSVSKEGGPAT